MSILTSEALLRENKKFQQQNITTPSEYWTQASNEPLIPLSILD